MSVTKFRQLTALHFEVWEDSDGIFVGRCMELDVYSQGGSLREAKKAVRSATRLTLEGTARNVAKEKPRMKAASSAQPQPNPSGAKGGS